MSIFQREDGDSPSQTRPPSPRPSLSAGGAQTTVVAAGSRVKGEISGATDVLIDGQVDGQLVLGSSVVVGEGGEVLGQIQARRVKIGGKVRGDIRASERVEVLASGRIEGDVVAPRVAINAGAFFKGKVEMTSDPPQSKPAAPADDKAAAPDRKPAGPPEQQRLDDPGAESQSSATAES
jgi:cytoskeletal protein CcmA (bactofilin family)